MILKKKNKIILAVILIIIILLAAFFYLKEPKKNTPIDSSPFRDEAGRLVVSTSLFPVYDFAKIVGGDKVSVSLILPAGSEAHSFLPADKDLETIKKTALFFYTSDIMEPWAASLKNEVSAKTKIEATANGLNDDSLDPHVWLDFSKASLMVDAILKSYQTIDPGNSAYYEANASVYEKQLSDLDLKFATGLKDCQFKEFISGGHFTFGYLAKRYNLKYQAASGFVPSSEVNTEKMTALGDELKASGQPYVYYEEMIIPQLAVILRQESGVQMLPLNAAHNVGKHDIEGGFTFISLMENDLKILEFGLKCR